MKRSIMCVGWTLGSAALFALGMGCSHEERPAQTAPAGTTSPPFESSVPNAPQGQPPGAGPEAPMPPGGAAGQQAPTPMPPPEATAPPEEPKRGVAEQPAPTGPSERKLCDSLASAAKLRAEDVPNGVAIVATPKTGHDLASVRDSAHHMESAMHRSPAEAQAGGEPCGVFSIARMPGSTTSTTEGMSTVRIVITTSNPAEVRDLRRSMREQINNLSKTPGGR